ncbi:MAG: hypothetical protein QG596_712 [Actinomycetota bacterium]|jgi:hypothetical protein|nr:hypothetical protein [Actinomycetota bacterium]
MSSYLKKFSVPSVLAVGLAAVVLSACGGSSGDSGANELAKYAPADSTVFVEGAVQPSSEVAANVDSISEDLAGVNVGDLIKDGISSSSGDVDFDTDIQPWLGENAAVFVSFDPAALAGDSGLDTSGLTSMETSIGDTASASYPEDEGEKFGLVVETSDPDAAKSFIDKMAEEEGGATDGEYEGFSYKVSADDGSAVGIVDDFVVIGSTEEEFKAAVDASKGDNLADTSAFSDLSDHTAEGALMSVFTAYDPYLEALKEQGVDLTGLATALGMDLEGSGSVMSMVPEQDQISMQGYTNAGSEMTSGDPSAVIETFPADTMVALGSGDVDANATKIMNALNSEGIPGVLEPGEIDKLINEASGQIDVKRIIDSLETVAFFVNGSTEQTVGGALVATSSNIEPIESSLRGISSLIGLAGDARVRPLPGGIAGFRVFTPELPGRPVVIGVKGDRMVIGIGMKASMTALTGSGQTLADSAAYKAAEASIPGEGLDMFANPGTIADLVQSAGAGEPDAKEIAEIMRKFEFMVAGSSDSEGTSEFNMGMKK